jgi:hypothetical protein
MFERTRQLYLIAKPVMRRLKMSLLGIADVCHVLGSAYGINLIF